MSFDMPLGTVFFTGTGMFFTRFMIMTAELMASFKLFYFKIFGAL
jgi:hypothetical protein